MRPSLLVALAAVACLCAGPASAELWRWTDADGVVRYTPSPERVPAGSRGTLTRVEAGMPRVVPTARPAAPGAAPLQGVGEFDFDPDPFNAPEQAQTLRGAQVPEPLELETAPRAPEAASASRAPAPAPAPARPAPRPVPLDAETLSRRDALQSQIARDEAALKDLISSGATRGDEPSAELREIAERLPALQAELREIERRAAGGSGSPTP